MLFPVQGYYEYRHEHSCTSLFVHLFLFFMGKYLGMEFLDTITSVCLTLKDCQNCFSAFPAET